MAGQKAVAFMSYVHSDDRYGHVTNFHERLSHEVKIVVGFEIPIFLDSEDIRLGQSWQRRIEDALDEAFFFIPILTPSFFNSEYCRAELRRFLEREQKLGRDDLVLPVYFVDAPILNEEELRAGDDLALVIAARQRVDWRNLRHEPFTTPLVGRALEKLAAQIRDALPRVRQRTAPAAPGPAALRVPPPDRSDEASSVKTTTPQPTKVEPPTCIVDSMYRGDFASITEAIRESVPGMRIIVRPGQYNESLLIDKPLEIIGEGDPGDVVVQATGKDVILFQTAMGRVRNLTIRQAGGGKWFGVDIAQGSLELENCDITSQSLACVAIHNGAAPRLRRNRIHDGKQGGVYVFENGFGTLEDNDISGNTYAGVSITEGGNPTLRNNRINKNGYQGIRVYDGGGGTFEGNDLRGNLKGAWRIDADCEANVKRSGNQEL